MFGSYLIRLHSFTNYWQQYTKHKVPIFKLLGERFKAFLIHRVNTLGFLPLLYCPQFPRLRLGNNRKQYQKQRIYLILMRKCNTSSADNKCHVYRNQKQRWAQHGYTRLQTTIMLHKSAFEQENSLNKQQFDGTTMIGWWHHQIVA